MGEELTKIERIDAPAPTRTELLAALRAADAVLRAVYVRTGDLEAADAHDAAFEIIYRAERAAGRAALTNPEARDDD